MQYIIEANSSGDKVSPKLSVQQQTEAAKFAGQLIIINNRYGNRFQSLTRANPLLSADGSTKTKLFL